MKTPTARLVAMLVFGCLIPVVAAGQDATAPLTAWGAPDLGGVWDFRTITPLERPAALKDKAVLTAEEAAAFTQQSLEGRNADRRDGGARRDIERAYNDFWWDYGNSLTGDNRTSLIVDPPTGRIPYREEYQAAARIRGANISNGFADSYTDRSLSDRCLMGFNAGPPMVSSAYNNNVQILQTPHHVVILNEMVHNARIVPLDPRSHGRLRQYAGDSRGRWEGETLVVETRNFLRETSLGGSSRDTYLVERFRRVDPDTVMYEFTVEDVSSYTRPWTARMPLRRTDGPLFEYACHEGNIGLAGILAGARNLDTQRISVR